MPSELYNFLIHLNAIMISKSNINGDDVVEALSHIPYIIEFICGNYVKYTIDLIYNTNTEKWYLNGFINEYKLVNEPLKNLLSILFDIDNKSIYLKEV